MLIKIEKEYDDNDVAFTDDKKLVAFYTLRDVQPLFLRVTKNERVLYAYSKLETAEYYDIWRSMKPSKENNL